MRGRIAPASKKTAKQIYADQRIPYLLISRQEAYVEVGRAMTINSLLVHTK